jgi:L-fucose dehydrogenase
MLLAREGAIAVILSRSADESLKTVQEIEAAGGKAFQFQAELSNPDECREAVEKVIAKFGRIDGLVNNAGENDGVGLQNGGVRKVYAIPS